MDHKRTDPEILRDIGARLRSYRLQRNIASEDLAHQAAISRTTLAKMESGTDFRVSSLLRVLRVLNRLDALDAFLPPVTVSPLGLLTRTSQAPRKRAYRSRARASSTKAIPRNHMVQSVPVFEGGSGIARIGVPTAPLPVRKTPGKKQERAGRTVSGARKSVHARKRKRGKPRG